MRFGAVFLLFVLAIFSLSVSQENPDKQTPFQTVKGRVLDYQTQAPIARARVTIVELAGVGDLADSSGYFAIEKVPVGRYNIKVTAVAYDPYYQPIAVTSGRQTKLNVQMRESFFQTEEVTVTAEDNAFDPVNEAAIVSSTVFTVDDVERYAGSRMDPARMAQNFPGVLGDNDTRNDIIVRGGSPSELLWRLDNLDIPNPNHFATQGATGGPVSMLNSSILDNSDFLTGAFPAQYANRLSAVFDLRTRKGNSEDYEFMGQFGFNGFELGAEGPIEFINGKNSFIGNFRYSFLDLMEKAGLDFGFSGIPRYWDGTLKIDVDPTDYDRFSLTALFGSSSISIKESETDDPITGDFDIDNGTDMVSVGLNWRKIFNEDLFGNATVGTVYSKYFYLLDSLTVRDGEVTSIDPWVENNSVEGYRTAKYTIRYSPNSKNFVSAGTEFRYRFYSLDGGQLNPDLTNPWILDESGGAVHSLNFINWNRRLSETFEVNVGVHSQYLEINNQATIEPRIGVSWSFLPKQSIRFGWGLHRQSPALITFYSEPENKNLDFMQSIHYVAGYQFAVNPKAIFKAEGYFKDISKAPVEKYKESSWSALNSGAEFGTIRGLDYEAASEGLGKAYGAELAFMKTFSDNYYVTATASYVRQEYKASDGVWRYGAFDNIFIGNLLAGYEINVSPGFDIEIAGKYTIAGGKPYTPVDLEESRKKGSTVYLEEKAYSKRAPDYSRLDFRVDFRHNMRNVSIVSFFSIENVLNKDNVLYYRYNSSKDDVEAVSQLGFFPVGGVRVEF